ncbi:hypothetical protein BCR44DRAFT_1496589 [Catenaria anguillulae PL171]|uniref:Peroxiredoxin-like 2A n=1 Tax=Catenaria anguillulae PL171 TaxID=765915 RepID=A0A1Y2HWP5_9FUNG|nr:hypothetical protein BCR44DRAFT_1496589 [Catenaria anguillulae PL171]
MSFLQRILGNAPTKTNGALLSNVNLIPIPYPPPAEGTAAEVPKPVVSQSLWEKSPALIVLIRRPGCLLCRQEAIALNEQRELIAKQYGIRMVAILNQEFGSQDFVTNWWKGEAYFDKDLGLFKAMGDGTLRRASLLQLMLPSVIARGQKAKQVAEGNLQGDGTMLGGLLIMRPGDKGMQYDYAETEFGDHAPIETVLENCKKVAEEFGTAVQVQASA